jgi:hypothetical protein
MIIEAFWNYAVERYPASTFQRGARPGGEPGNYRDALRPLKSLYAGANASEFTGVQLKAPRLHMIKLGWCRKYVNRCGGCT